MKKNYLADVAPDKVFWVYNGGTLKNMEELAGALKGISAEQFKHHVNKERNDFTSWVKDIIGDKALAANLFKVKRQSAAANAVKKRISQLKKKRK
ncbi:hypothetical protein JXB11_00405 [Candidatus Woesearchaeota archaeon]|nr:hypothetical protein [Candidatus Woesearchaeota archaeon]